MSEFSVSFHFKPSKSLVPFLCTVAFLFDYQPFAFFGIVTIMNTTVTNTWIMQCILRFIAIFIISSILLYVLCKLNPFTRSVEFYQTSSTKLSFLITIIAYIFFIISIISDIINILYLFKGKQSLTSFGILENLYILCWNLGHIACYILFIHRLRIKLQENAKYMLSHLIYVIFGIFIILYLLHCIIIGLYTMIQSKSTTFLSDHQYWLNMDYYIGAQILDFLISIYLLSIFGNRLFKVTLDLYHNLNDIKHKSVILEEQQKLLSSSFSKYFVLSTIAIISTQIVTMTLCFGWLYVIADRNHITEYHYVGIFQNFFHFTTPLDMIINSICLLLMFDEMEHRYLCLCYKLHSCVQLCFYYWIQRRAKTSKPKLSDTELQTVLLDAI